MIRTTRVLFLLVLFTAFAWAHAVDTVPFRAVLTTTNVVPPVTGVTASGSATVLLHLTRVAGQITLGVVEFDVDFTTTGAIEVIGLRIYNAAAGVNGDIVIDTDLSANNRFSHPGGLGRINRQVALRDRAPLLNRILSSPDQLYISLVTAANPDGLIRGQLARAEVLVMRAHMSSLNENPPFPEIDATGSANIIALGVRNSAGEIVEGVVRFDVNYRFAAPDGTASGLHIHNGPAGINSGVVIQPNPGVAVAQGLAIEAGVGNITRGSANITSAPALTALRDLFAGQAAGHYVNLHSSAPGHGSGIIRGQLQYTGNVTLRTDLSPGNVVPPATVHAEAPATLQIYVTRNQAGQITAGAVVFDTNFEFPGQTEFLGMHIHRGAAGTEGLIVINSGLRGTTSAGAGNFFQIANVSSETPEALEALNGLLANPERYYLDIHTTAHPGGALRNQLSGAFPTLPSIDANGIVSATLDPSIAAASPGALIAIFGQNLIKVPLEPTSGLGLDGPYLPITLNGMDVRIGGQLAPILFANRTQINVQVPFDVEPGNRQVFVVRSGEFSTPVTLRVTPFSPAIFVTPLGAAVQKTTDFSLVSASNPARPNDILVIYCTGLGAVRPSVPNGLLAPSGPVSETLVEPSVTIGGVRANFIAAALTPGFIGLYQVAVQMPLGVPAGSRDVVITVGGLRSNAAPLAVGPAQP